MDTETWETKDRPAAERWAKGMLTRDFRILDTETTGLGNAEIVEIAIIDPDGKPLVNTLIKPTIAIPFDVTAIHGISNRMVKNAPTLPDVWGDIQAAITGKPLLIYNRSFDLGILEYCRRLHDLPPLSLSKTECIMLWYAQWYGEWNSYYNNYRWQKLYGGHRAFDDCLAARYCLDEMAGNVPDDPEPLDPLDKPPF